MFKKTALTLTVLSIASTAFAMSDIDTNADDVLSLNELKAAYPEISEDQFARADANDDGVLTQQELADAVQADVLPDLKG